MNREDWTLLALSAAQGEPLTPVQLQKSLFLLGMRSPEPLPADFYDFEPYNYGPFDIRIYKDAEELERRGFVRIDREAPGRTWALYQATAAGLDEATRIRASAPQRALKYLDEVVAWTRKLTFRQLVSAVYDAYPEQRVNSIFRA